MLTYSAASLDQYRNHLHGQAERDLEDTQKVLTAGLDALTRDLQHHLESLGQIEEPLQRPFATESIKLHRPADPESRTEGQQMQEVLLDHQISAFRKLMQDKEGILQGLWEEWEQVQLQLISLAAEALGRDGIVFAQTRDEDLKAGQKERLEDALNIAQRIHEEQCSPEETLEQDLTSFEGDMVQLASRTKQTVADMQQVRRLGLIRSTPTHFADRCGSNTMFKGPNCSKG
jgi:phytoene dehydrogenase-like protein